MNVVSPMRLLPGARGHRMAVAAALFAYLGIVGARAGGASRLFCLCLAGAAALTLGAPSAQALPSYARQTGQECAACHNGFPELTPYGRLFKLNAYTFKGGDSNLPPIAMMITPSFTHTDKDQPGGAAPHFGPNDNFSFSGSLFYGGAITSHIGALAQVTYDHAARNFNWDNLDVRYAQATTILDRESVFGATVNNNPTVTDLWNSTPAWGFPFVSSALAPTPAAGTLIEGGLAQQVLGISAYNYWNRLIYAEFGGYRTLSPRTETTLGIAPGGTSAIKGFAPYWRLAVSPSWGRNSLEVGIFGIAASLIPGRVRDNGTDHLTDFGFDTQYQWLGARDSVSLQAYWITENQNLSASSALGTSSNTHNHLRSFRAKATYYYDQTYGATASYFHVNGTPDPLLFPDPSLTDAPVSANNSPNSNGWIGELDYIPFSHGGPSFWPWLNMKLGVQYVYYDKFNGGRTNFDGAGRNAHDNNTVFLFAWLAF
jgi:hypothetical protein